MKKNEWKIIIYVAQKWSDWIYLSGNSVVHNSFRFILPHSYFSQFCPIHIFLDSAHSRFTGLSVRMFQSKSGKVEKNRKMSGNYPRSCPVCFKQVSTIIQTVSVSLLCLWRNGEGSDKLRHFRLFQITKFQNVLQPWPKDALVINLVVLEYLWSVWSNFNT